MKLGYLAGALALSACVQQATAFSDSAFTATTNFSTTADTWVSITLDTTLNLGGPYTLTTPTVTGDGINENNFTDRSFNGVGGFTTAACESYTAAVGSAAQSQGEATFLFITNHSTDLAGHFSISETIAHALTSIGDADTFVGGGFQEIGGSGAFGELDSRLLGDGTVSSFTSGSGITGSYLGNGNFSGSGGFSDILAPGKTIEVQIYSAGLTNAFHNRVAAPEPFTMSLGVAGIAVFLRRRRKQA